MDPLPMISMEKGMPNIGRERKRIRWMPSIGREGIRWDV
jgi:hypothetical protein